MDKEKIGIFISKLRKEKKLTQEDLANLLFVDRGTVSKWERGVYVPNPEMLVKISGILEVSVNELIYGERKTGSNEIEVNNIPVEIIKDSNKKIKKITSISVLIIILLAFSFLFYYFVSTYKSIKVYRIRSDSEEYTIDEGMIITSRKKVYIKMGNVKKLDGKQIKLVRVLYKIKNKEKELYYYSYNQLDDSSTIFTNVFGKEQVFSYRDSEKVIKNLILEITFEDNERVKIPLEVKEDFINNNIFSKSYKDQKEENKEGNNGIPSYFLENFEYDPTERKYTKETEKDGIKIEEVYFIETQIYGIRELQGTNIKYFEYQIRNKQIIYESIISEKQVEKFCFSNNDYLCKFGECDESIINYFYDKYLINIEK